MGQMKRKFNKPGIETLPNDKPVVYEILTEGGKRNYIGTAGRGRVQERLQEHLGEIPGAEVRIHQMKSISEARESEARRIKSNQPKYNTQGK